MKSRKRIGGSLEENESEKKDKNPKEKDMWKLFKQDVFILFYCLIAKFQKDHK